MEKTVVTVFLVIIAIASLAGTALLMVMGSILFWRELVLGFVLGFVVSFIVSYVYNRMKKME